MWGPSAEPCLSFPKTGEHTVRVVPLADARKNVGVFVRSKNSARNCSAARSLILKFLNAEKSVFTDPGPRATCRAELPKSWIGAPVLLGTVPGIRNAAGLKY